MGLKFKISCDEATTICDKNQYGEATFFEKIQLNIHFLFCRICGKYSKQNTQMSKIYNMKANDCKKVKHCLSETEKDQLKKDLQEVKA